MTGSRPHQLLRGILDRCRRVHGTREHGAAGPDSPEWAAWRPRFSSYDVVIQTCNENGNNGLLLNLKKKPDWPDAVKTRLCQNMSAMAEASTSFTLRKMPSSAGKNTSRWSASVGAKRITAPPSASTMPERWSEFRRMKAAAQGTASDRRRAGNAARRRSHPHRHATGLDVARHGGLLLRARSGAELAGAGLRARFRSQTGLLWPVEWTTTYGKGRVYISTYGHVWPGDVDPRACAARRPDHHSPRAGVARRATAGHVSSAGRFSRNHSSFAPSARCCKVLSGHSLCGDIFDGRQGREGTEFARPGKRI